MIEGLWLSLNTAPCPSVKRGDVGMNKVRLVLRKPMIRLILICICFLIVLYLWRWYGPTPYRTLRLFIKALREKNAEAIWELCGGDSLQSMLKDKKIEWNAFRLPPKEKFSQFLDKFVFSQIPQGATLSWTLNPIMTGRFLWFQLSNACCDPESFRSVGDKAEDNFRELP
jgi:hypothetical protein